MDDEGRSKDYAVVHFRIEEGMEKAVQALNKHTLKGKDRSACLCVPRDRIKGICYHCPISFAIFSMLR